MTVSLLKAELADRGLSVRQAARQIGVSRTTLDKAISGGSLHPATAKQIADFVGVKVTDIWPVTDDDLDLDDGPLAATVRRLRRRELVDRFSDEGRTLEEEEALFELEGE